ncbi:MAG: hypothetical protein COB04_12670 [Gammaproteobacteria bacterium]|nr:MAG: hypothetical protein COB04_12670 [Gammaproteobacteria bacterium]
MTVLLWMFVLFVMTCRSAGYYFIVSGMDVMLRQVRVMVCIMFHDAVADNLWFVVRVNCRMFWKLVIVIGI